MISYSTSHYKSSKGTHFLSTVFKDSIEDEKKNNIYFAYCDNFTKNIIENSFNRDHYQFIIKKYTHLAHCNNLTTVLHTNKANTEKNNQ